MPRRRKKKTIRLALPASELEARRKTGIGWTHSNLMQTAFGPIFDTPFGTGGDLMIVPDASAEVEVDFADQPDDDRAVSVLHPVDRRATKPVGFLPAHQGAA